MNTCRIFHGINVSEYPETSRMHKAQKATIASIVAQPELNMVFNLAIGDDDMPVSCIPKDWTAETVDRTGSSEVYDIRKNYLYINDMFDVLAAHASDDDWIMVSNSDCLLGNGAYSNILRSDKECIRFRRIDLDELGAMSIAPYGIDGIAMRKRVWLNIRDLYGDFLIGALHWDAGMEILTRTRGISSIEDVETLYHHKHEEQWDLSNLRVEDVANIRQLRNIFSETLHIPMGDVSDSGCVQWDSDKGVPTKQQSYDDVVVVMCIWGTNATHIKNARETIIALKKQSQKTHLILVEAIPPGTHSRFADMPIEQHVVLAALGASHEGIFQKEALWNMGAKMAPQRSKLIFMDADIVSRDIDWLYKIRNKLSFSENTIVQGFRYVHDDADPKLSSYGAVYSTLDNHTYPHINPGLCYGMSKYCFDVIGGFNTCAITTGGDVIFLTEILPENASAIEVRKWLSPIGLYEKFISQMRPMPVINSEYVMVDILHLTHGTHDSREYGKKVIIPLQFKRPTRYITHLDTSGLLCWNDCGSDEHNELVQ